MTKLVQPTLAEYEEMVIGTWAWSTDGNTQNAFLILNTDKNCEF